MAALRCCCVAAEIQVEEKETKQPKEGIQPPPRTLKSDVWRYFGFYRGKNGLDRTHAICRLCNAKVEYFGNTSNPRAHLDRQHPELSEEKDHPQTPTTEQRTLHHFTKLPFSSERAKKITRSIACFIAKDLRPYSAVEREGFRFMIKTIEPRYDIPSRSVFTNNIVPSLYRETKLNVGKAVTIASRVALTCDHWISRTTESYATFTAPYITEWGLMLTDLVIVTDNAPNMTTAMQLDELTHITCYAHTLNLAAQKALKIGTLSQVLGRIRQITGYFHRSTIAREALKASQAEKGITDNTLITDFTTRWNRAHDMVERFLKHLPAICAALVSPGVRKYNTADTSMLSDAEIKYAEDMAMTLRPLKDATKIMSEDSSPTLSVIAPLNTQLLHDTKGDLADPPHVRDIKRAVHDHLVTRYSSEKTKNLLHMAFALDPRSKVLPFFAGHEQLDIIHARLITEAAALKIPAYYYLPIIFLWTKIKHIFLAGTGEANSSPVEPESGQEEGPAPKRRTTSATLVNLLGKTFTEDRIDTKSASTRAEEELKKYLEEPAHSLTEDPLDWWKFKESDVPLLAKLAKRFLCIPGTSVAAERVFSTAGDVVTAQRSCLSPEHVDHLIFLQKNLQISDC
ncbi:E3 SUMO-protein ligase ZBED1-like [Nerophis ophidion]|uniref:E3 SUMO-protein ligase ZBED1-like n=1 Tax=Nerophis ophidion TaxID=159077 RepID=UPI002ADF65BF|nr:E3 SUMO-protein ligase ZBED1-like [Nerophis ophidion]